MTKPCMLFLSRRPYRITQQQTLCLLFLLISCTPWLYGDINCCQICHAIRNIFMQQMLPDDTEFTLNTE